MAEHLIGKVDEFPDGQMKQVDAGGLKLLIVNRDGTLYVVGGECSHQGAPLAEGVLRGGRVRCPWHQACFCVRSGQVDEPPALDWLTRFEVRVKDGRVIVSVPDGAKLHRHPDMASYDPKVDGRTFVLVGGGAAAAAAAEALRHGGYQGRIVMITREACGPYDRTELSKYYLAKAAAPKVALRTADFYKQCGVELMTGCEVTAVDPAARRIELASGESLRYDACLLATGSRARRLKVPGADLPGVLTLRSQADADAVRAAAAGAQNVVVVGASFIGTEVAGSLTKAGKSVTVLAPESVPLERVLGAQVGAALRALHEKNGTLFRLGVGLDRFEGDGRVEAVVLEDTERLPADLVVVGVGAQPITGYLRGLELSADGSISVDATMRAADGLWAAGDIARFPDPRTGEPIRVEHWRLALQLGRVAAMNMAGRPTRYDDMPFFWTDQAGTVLAYVGYAPMWDDTIVDGNVESGSGFLVHYVQEGQVRAACAVYRDAEMGAIAELMRADAMPTPDELRAGNVDLVERARQIHR